MRRKQRRPSRQASDRAIERGVQIGLRQLSEQLLKINDRAALEACALITLAATRLMRDEKPVSD